YSFEVLPGVCKILLIQAAWTSIGGIDFEICHAKPWLIQGPQSFGHLLYLCRRQQADDITLVPMQLLAAQNTETQRVLAALQRAIAQAAMDGVPRLVCLA